MWGARACSMTNETSTARLEGALPPTRYPVARSTGVTSTAPLIRPATVSPSQSPTRSRRSAMAGRSPSSWVIVILPRPSRRPFLRRLLRPQHTGGMSNAWQDLRILTGNDWRSVRGDPSCVRLRPGAALSDPGAIPLWKRWQDVALAWIAVVHEQIRQSVVFCGESALAIHGVPSGSPILTWSSPAGGRTRPHGSRASTSATNACPGFGCAASPGSTRCAESGTCAACQWRTFGRRAC